MQILCKDFVLKILAYVAYDNFQHRIDAIIQATPKLRGSNVFTLLHKTSPLYIFIGQTSLHPIERI